MGSAAGQGISFHTPRAQKESFFVVEYNLGVLRGADLTINLVEIRFLHYSYGYWEFPGKEDSQVMDVKCVFMRPCIPGLILGQNCIRLFDSALYSLIFSKVYIIKNSVNML